MTQATRSIERCLSIQAPRERVYRALLDPGTLSRWMYATVRWVPTKGSSYRIEWRNSNLPASAQGEILDIEENERLVLSWNMERDDCETVASFDLEDGDSGSTFLRFRHAGFPADPAWQVRFDMVALEWDKVLENLRFLVEEGGENETPFFLRFERPLPASRERAHLHWVGPDALRAWIARGAFIDPAPGGEFEMLLSEGGIARGIIRTFIPGRHMRMLWEEDGKRSLVGLSFWPEGAGSVTALTIRSFALRDSDRARVLDQWQKRLDRLEQSLARVPGSWPRAGEGSLTVERIIASPRAQVWRALTDPAAQVAWFCDRSEFTPQAMHPYHFLWTSFGEQSGVVREIRPPERLSMLWEVSAVRAATDVDVTLADAPAAAMAATGESASATRVIVEHRGWGRGADWAGEEAAHRSGWRSVLAMLDFYTRHADAGHRRSFLLRARVSLPPAEIGARLTTNAGLESWVASNAAVEAVQGGPFRAVLPGEDVLEGRIAAIDPERMIALDLDRPDPTFIEISWSEGLEGRGSEVLVSGIAFGVSEHWSVQQRIHWAERLGKLSGL